MMEPQPAAHSKPPERVRPSSRDVRVNQRQRPATAQRSSKQSALGQLLANYTAHDDVRASGTRRSAVARSTLEDFVMLNELGRGAFGVVRKARLKTDGREYVLKEIPLGQLSVAEQRSALSEVLIMRKLDHPHIVKYYNSFVAAKTLYIVMEYAGGGSVHDLVRHYRGKQQHISEATVWRIFWELCSAVSYLHSRNVTHRDLSSGNILLDKQRHVRVVDLGVSCVLGTKGALMHSRVGTPLFLPPEVVKKRPYDSKCDTWGVGCVVYNLLSLRPPFSGDNLIELAQNIAGRKPPQPIPKHYTQSIASLVARLLTKDPAHRPTIDEAIALFPAQVEEQMRKDSKRASGGSARDTETAVTAAAARHRQHFRADDERQRNLRPSTAPVNVQSRGGRRPQSAKNSGAMRTPLTIAANQQQLSPEKGRGGGGSGAAAVGRRPATAAAAPRRQQQAARSSFMLKRGSSLMVSGTSSGTRARPSSARPTVGGGGRPLSISSRAPALVCGGAAGRAVEVRPGSARPATAGMLSSGSNADRAALRSALRSALNSSSLSGAGSSMGGRSTGGGSRYRPSVFELRLQTGLGEGAKTC